MGWSRKAFAITLSMWGALWFTVPGMAQDSQKQSSQQAPQPASSQIQQQSAREREFEAALEDLRKVAKKGPEIITLNDQGSLRLPEGYAFIPEPQASRFLRALGNSASGSSVGLILPVGGEQGWIATVDFIRSGYIKDEEAKSWDADALLNNLREGTNEGNRDRVARGFPALQLKGWIEKPHYDAQKRHLIWSAHVHAVGEQDNEDSVNYNTYALGREGYFSINLITSVDSIEAQKPQAKALLEALLYAPGKNYADYNPSTDRVAEYGIAALVGGAVAKKLGLLAIIGVFLVKIWKIVLIALIAGGGLIGKLFRRKPSS